MITIEGPRRIGNMNLSTVPTNHLRVHWEDYKGVIKSAISDFDNIAVEYFPPEYTKFVQSTPFLGKAVQELDEEKNYLFNEVAKILRESGKNVWVLDPAYGGEFVGLRTALHFPPMLFLAGLSALSAAIAANDLYQHHKETKLKRRDFLKAFGLGAISVAAGLQTGYLGYGAIVGPSHTPGLSSVLGRIEDDFRENITAENLVTLGKTLPKETDMLFITTPLHRQREEWYLNHDDAREFVYSAYHLLSYFNSCKPFFQIRNYPNGVVV